MSDQNPPDSPDNRPRVTGIDALEVFAGKLEQRQRYSERNRLALLTAHGVGLVLACAFLIYDDPARAVLYTFGSASDAFHIVPGVGGLLLLGGLILNRNLPMEAAGMTLGLMWDVGMMLAFLNAALADPGALPAPTGTASIYPIAIYGTLAALMVIHLTTLVVILRESRRG